MDLELVKLADPLHLEVTEILMREARLLDNDQLGEWLELFTEDVTYRAPVRVTMSRKDGRGFVGKSAHFDEDYASLHLRVRRVLETASAWSEDPPSRTLRFVSNITVARTDDDDVINVSSYLLLLRNRLDNPTFDLLPAQRDDIFRRCGDCWKIASRNILLHQASLGTPNMALFI